MIKILIVDDSNKRIEKFKEVLSKMDNSVFCHIDTASYANEAENLMSLGQYDLLVLDVVLPKKNNDVATANTGLNLLKNINKTNGDIFLPKKIIGITAHFKDIENFRNDFDEYTSIIYEAKINSKVWITKIINYLNSLVNTELKKSDVINNKLLITFHGIRTFGDWQEQLEKQLFKKTNNFESERMKYNFFSIFLFIIPFLRQFVVNHLLKDFENILKNNSEKEIYIIGHSFGTYLAIKLLEKSNTNVKINTLILSGSVMPSTYNLNKILEKNVKKILNECARDDYILVLCKLFVPLFSDAGRIGFIGRNNHKVIINRFYSGGHSTYFKNFETSQNIMNKYWLPILIDNNFSIVSDGEISTPNILSDFIEPTLTFCSYFKNIFFVILPFYCIFYYFYSN